MNEEEQELVKKIYKIKEQIEIEQLKGKVKTNKNIAIKEKIDDITNDDETQAKYNEMIKKFESKLIPVEIFGIIFLLFYLLF